MKKNFAALLCCILLTAPFLLKAQANKKTGEYYQISVYYFTNNEQQTMLDDYLKNAYLPALHRRQIKSIGVFTPISNDTAKEKRLYVIVPFKSLQAFEDLDNQLEKDNAYQSAGKAYINAVYDKPAFSRKENILLKSFPLAPSLVLPKLTSAVSERVYELRSYESASEKIFQNKVKMFNEGGEISLFKRLNFNAVFYASVIAGCHMPNLMYMTSFENMADRDAHWKSFGADAEWKTLSGKPEYQKNVSHIDIIFMRATPYSDY